MLAIDAHIFKRKEEETSMDAENLLGKSQHTFMIKKKKNNSKTKNRNHFYMVSVTLGESTEGATFDSGNLEASSLARRLDKGASFPHLHSVLC